MTPLTKTGITEILGPIDESLAADIAMTGADERELREAYAWMQSDEALVNDLRPLPKGRVADLIELLSALDEPFDEQDL